MKILIIDESVFIREKLKRDLYEINTSITIQEEAQFDHSLITLSTFHPDLVILEMDLLYENGVKLLKKIKAKPFSPSLIIFTDHSTDQFKTGYLEAGADYFFDKSKEYFKIIEITNQMLSGQLFS